MEKKILPGEVPVTFVICLVAGAAGQWFMPVSSLLLGFAATFFVVGVVTGWRIRHGQGTWPSLIRGLTFAVGWCAGMLIVHYRP